MKNHLPMRVFIQNQCTPMYGFTYQFVMTMDDMWIYQTIASYQGVRFMIMIRKTHSIPLVLNKAQFPISTFDATTWGAPELPMDMKWSYLSCAQSHEHATRQP